MLLAVVGRMKLLPTAAVRPAALAAPVPVPSPLEPAKRAVTLAAAVFRRPPAASAGDGERNDDAPFNAPPVNGARLLPTSAAAARPVTDGSRRNGAVLRDVIVAVVTSGRRTPPLVAPATTPMLEPLELLRLAGIRLAADDEWRGDAGAEAANSDDAYGDDTEADDNGREWPPPPALCEDDDCPPANGVVVPGAGRLYSDFSSAERWAAAAT